MKIKSKGKVAASQEAATPKALPQKRRAGQRAGVTMDTIVSASLAVVSRRSGELNVKLVAEELGVTYGSVGAKLKNAGTTLEQELAKFFLTSILNPHSPGDKWKDRIISLFQNSLLRANASPEVARLVAPLIAQNPLLEPDFSDKLLYILREAGLAPDDCSVAFDIVLAGLSGTLSVCFPDFHVDRSVWSERLTNQLQKVEQQRWSSLHFARSQLAARVGAKAAAMDGQPSAEITAFGKTMASLVITKIELMHFNSNL